MKLPSFFDPDPENLNYKPDWKQMKPADRASYIWTYYKLPIVIAVIAVCLIIQAVTGYLRRTNDILFTGYANMVIPDDRIDLLTNGYIASIPSHGKRDSVSLTYLGYLSEEPTGLNPQEAFAAQMKVLATIEAGALDVVIMDQTAFDIFSINGFLQDLSSADFDQAIPEQLRDKLIKNTVLIESNAAEAQFDPTVELHEVTEEQLLGVDLSGSPLFSDLTEDGNVYAGIITAPARLDESLSYIAYLLDAQDRS